MGNYLDKCKSKLTPKKVVFLGLDAAGKTTIIYKLSHSEPIQTIPTIGFNVETISFQGFEISAWDVGGRSNLRVLWRHYYKNSDGLIFVIDANDRDRLQDAAEQLDRTLAEEEFIGRPVLVFANKCDLPNALSSEEILQALKLDSTHRKYHICRSVATTGEGLKEGMKWLATTIESSKN